MLTDMGKATETLVVKKVEAQLEGTRILQLLRILITKSNISVADCVMILIMIYQSYPQTYAMLHPPQTGPPPAPQVTVNVTVDSDEDEIAKEAARRRGLSADASAES